LKGCRIKSGLQVAGYGVKKLVAESSSLKADGESFFETGKIS
jgi:hypothetical protein